MTKKKENSEMDASGAIIADEDKKVDMSHPSVDSNPRQGEDLPEESNQIDFNTPAAHKAQEEMVSENLKANSKR